MGLKKYRTIGDDYTNFAVFFNDCRLINKEIEVESKHDWTYVPFSSHHGWEEKEYVCSICGEEIKSNNPPKGPCIYT